MEKELSNEEKQILGQQAIESFIEQFKPIDKHSIVFLQVFFELLMQRKIKNDF